MPRFDTTKLSNSVEAKNNDCVPSRIWGERRGIKAEVPEFGDDMKKHFLLGNDYKNKTVAFCNHGSYGATPQYVMGKRIELLWEIEVNPDLWYRSEMLKRELLSTEKLADFVGAASSRDLIYVDNVTEGTNIILKVRLL